jgi:ribosomal protein S18 acetylase RimI-like enzyme
MPEFTVAPAGPDDRAAALALAFWHLPPVARLERIAAALDLIDRGELDPEGIIVARSGRRLIGAMIAAPVPGAGAAVWPPQIEPDTPDEDAIADQLVRFGSDWLRRAGTKLAQALLAPEDVARAAPLARNGFSHTTGLWYLRHYLDLPAELLGEPERLSFESYAAGDSAEFAATLGRSYAWSQDFPEINGARTVEEALAGHRATGFDPERWWLARAGGEPVGVLLVCPAGEDGGWEVAYVGVVPEQRRRGYGRELLRKALFEAKVAGQTFITLSVDARNLPARELYRRLGFELHDRREVFLAVWGSETSGPPG